MIDRARVEVDGGFGADGKETRAHLILEGDFEDKCVEYLENRNATRLALRVTHDVAEELYKSLGEVLWKVR